MWRDVMAAGLAAGLVLGGAPARAQQQTATPSQNPPRPASSNLRAYTLRNMSGKVITQAHAYMSNDKTDLVTSQSAIQPNQAQNFGTDQKGCLDHISVTFKDGQTLDSGKLADCHVQTMVVRADKITGDTSAVPGATPPANPSDH